MENVSKSQSIVKIGFIVAMIFVAAFSRILPHPYNFSPLAAMGIFGAAFFDKKWLAYLTPFLALFLSDLVINNVIYAQYYSSFTFFYEGFYWQYLSYALIITLAFVTLKKVNLKNVIGTSLSSSIIFFIISNFGAWLTSGMYTANLSGLVSCYVAAIPFFSGSFAGDLFYCGIMFGAYLGVAKFVPQLQIAK